MQFELSHLSRRRFLRGLGAMTALSVVPGCGRQTPVDVGDREQIINIGNGSEPQDLDPHLITGQTEHYVVMSLMEGLVTEDPTDLHPIPGAAESWDVSPDLKVYTFHLRQNGKWSNGEPLTATDFFESFKRILTQSLGSEYSYMHWVVKNARAYNEGTLKNFAEVGYKVLDDHTFRVTLENPTPYFLSLINNDAWYPVPMKILRKYGDPYLRGNRWTHPGHFVGNGPFALSKWRVNDVVAVKKSLTYWDHENVRLNGINFYPIESDDTEERAFRSGQLHATYTMPLAKIDYYKEHYPDLLHISAFLGSYFYKFNVTKPPLNDKRVRQALTMAIDREAIVKTVMRGGQLPAYNLVPPGTAGYTCRTLVKEDIAEAKRLLTEAGYPDGKGLPTIELLYNTLESHRTIAEAIQQMWKSKLGIDVRLVNQEWKVYLDAQRTLDYQICRASWIGDYVDPNTFLDMWLKDGGNNETGWTNPEYDRLIAEASRTADPKQRLEVFQKAEAILMDELPILPIYFYTVTRAIRPEVKGWYPTILDRHPYKFVYLEKNAK